MTMNTPAQIGGYSMRWRGDVSPVFEARPFIDETGTSRIVTNSQGDTQIVTNGAALPYDAFMDIDLAVDAVRRERVGGIPDLMSRGLVHNLYGPGATVTMTQVSSDMTPADINMSGLTLGEKDQIRFDQRIVPVPVVHKDWQIEARTLDALRVFGQGVDTTAASTAASLVMEASERMLFAGAPITIAGGTVYGYRNFPGRGTVDLDNPWTSATPSAIKADVQAMLAAARTRRFYGPYTLYIPGAWEGVLDEFFIIEGGDDTAGYSIAAPNRTIREVLLSLSGLERIVVSDIMGSDGEAVLVQLSRDVVDLAVGQNLTTITWEEQGGQLQQFKTMAIWVPRIKADFDGRCGIIHLRPA